jgi:hypothetical protein
LISHSSIAKWLQAILQTSRRRTSSLLSPLGLVGEAPTLAGQFRGGQCRIFKLSFKDKESLAVRVPLYMSTSSQDEAIHGIKIEAELLKTLEMKGFHWAPRCRGYNLTFDNPVKHPFIVLCWVEGSKLIWDDTFPKQPRYNCL